MGNNLIDLNQQVNLKNLSPDEINIILNLITGSSTIDSKEPNIVIYGKYIKVHFKNNDRKILKILIENDFWKKNKTKILQAFDSANNPSSEQIYSRVVFTEEELQTYPFKWKNEFQLGRLPEENPKPKEVLGLYPCLFQFKVPQTENPFLNKHRANIIFKKLFLPLIPLLRQYCVTNLQYDAKTSSKKAWVIDTEEGFENKWLPLEYWIKSSLSTDSYYTYQQPKAKEFPIFEYDGYWSVSLKLSNGYLAYEVLDDKNKEMFLLGCEWFNKALTAHEPTDKFLFIMIMLEIFLPKDSTQCKECKQNIYSINKRFKTYIPEIIGENWTKDFEKVLGNLYSLRSNIAHNGIAVAEHSYGLVPIQLKEQNQLRYLFDLGRQFLVSWLGQIKKIT